MLLAEMTLGQLLLGLLIVGVCFFLIVVILLQRGRGGGLAGAFGGGGGSGTFGAKTGDVFTWITVSFAAVFLLLSIFANFVFDRSQYAIATPPGVSPGTPEGGAAIPVEGGAPGEIDGMKIELITDDGQAVPANVDFEVIPAGGEKPAAEGAGTQPAQPAAAPGEGTPPPSTDAPAGEGSAAEPDAGSGDTDDGAPSEAPKEPG